MKEIKTGIILSIIVCITLYAGKILVANENQPSDSLKISILTVSKGVEVHSLFGHTAIRVRNLDQQTDHVYNFGLFDFETPFFFYKFLAGKLPYKLGRHRYFDFLTIYASQNRSIDEQHLTLNISAKNKIADTLRYLLKPENRHYKYEFFDKNCTSIVRDIVLKYSGLSSSLCRTEDSITFRDMLNIYLENRPWYRLGINLITGSYTDKKRNRIEAMALPDMFMDGLNSIEIEGQPIVYKHNKIVRNESPNFLIAQILSPFNLFVVLLILFFLYKFAWIKYVMIGFSSVTGLFLVFLWLITAHIDLQNNWDILILNPFYLVLLCNKPGFKRIIGSITKILLFLLLIRAIISLTGLQELVYELIPIIMLNAAILVKLGKKQRLKIHQT